MKLPGSAGEPVEFDRYGVEKKTSFREPLIAERSRRGINGARSESTIVDEIAAITRWGASGLFCSPEALLPGVQTKQLEFYPIIS